MIKYGDYSSEVVSMLQDFAAGEYTHYSLQTLYGAGLVSDPGDNASVTEEGRRLLTTYEYREMD